jgi:hypothetical protein
MAASWRALALAMAAVGWVLGGCAWGFPAEDLVTRLPGQPPVTFRQFAGYVDVDVKAGRSLFYYFAEAQEGAAAKPLMLWLNGGWLVAGRSALSLTRFWQMLCSYFCLPDVRNLMKKIRPFFSPLLVVYYQSPCLPKRLHLNFL